MIWIAPSEKETVTETLEKRLRAAAEQAAPAVGHLGAEDFCSVLAFSGDLLVNR